MKYRLVITKKALFDASDAYNYYEGIRPRLGDRFIESLENRYAALSEHPDYYSDVAIDGFPYLIVYEISGRDVIVFSIHNTYKKTEI